MSLLKGIIPDEWILKFFPPNEDNNINKLYLTILPLDDYLVIKPDVSRYTIIEFIKQIHNDYDEIKDNISLLFKEYFESTNDIHNMLKPFMQEEIVFMNKSKIEIEHNKNDDDYWITEIYKIHSKDKKIKIAELASVISDNTVFSNNDNIIE
jgi:hypothetical protein